MTLRRNILANYLGLGWGAVMSLAFIPFYIRYLGIEAYGLVGLFATLQVWLNILDLGLAPTLSREMARFSAGAVSARFIRSLLHSIEIFYVAVAAVMAICLALAASYLANDWLRVETLPIESVVRALSITGVVIALRFCESIYRSAIIGLQQQVWLNVMSAFVATLRGLGAVFVLRFVSPSIEAFFIWQGVLSLFTVWIVRAKLRASLPEVDLPVRFSWAVFKEIRHFAGGMIGIAGLALILTQVDKLLLSRMLPLAEFGYYMVAANITNSLYLVVGPVVQAVYPVLVRLVASDNTEALALSYHRAAQLVTVLLAPAAGLLGLFPVLVLYAWSGDTVLAERAGPIVALLTTGTFFNCIMQFPVQLQLAYGWTRLALQTNIVAVSILIPALLWFVPTWGATAAAAVWAVLNIGYFLFQIPIMHRRILPSEKWHWYWDDVIQPIGAAALVFLPAIAVAHRVSFSRIELLAFLGTVGIVAIAAAAMAAATLRSRLVKMAWMLWRRRSVSL